MTWLSLHFEPGSLIRCDECHVRSELRGWVMEAEMMECPRCDEAMFVEDVVASQGEDGEE